MNKLAKFLLFASLCTLMFIHTAWAADSPEKVLEKIIVEMKAQKSPLPVLSYIDWPSAFQQLGTLERQQLGVQSANELKNVYESFIKNPREMLRQQMAGQLAAMPPEQRAMLEQQMEQAIATAEKRVKIDEQKYDKMQWEIGESTISGNKAKVRLKVTDEKGKVTNEEIDFVKTSSGEWRLPSLAFGDRRMKKGSGGQRPQAPATSGGLPASP